MRRAVLALVLLAAALIAPRAVAQALVLRPAVGTAPLELSPRPGYQLGRAVLENRGGVPLTLVSVDLRQGGDLDPRLPEALSAIVSDATATTLAPGMSLTIDVQWRLGRERRAREVYGHLVAETADGQRVALGFHGELGGVLPFFEKNPLSWLVFLPLFGLVALAAARAARYAKTKNLRFVALSVGLTQLALALFLTTHFDVDFTRFEGNDGLSLIERTVLWADVGLEYSLGIDGMLLPLLLLTPLLVSVCALASYTVDRRLEAYWALVLVADIGLMGMACAVDLALWLGFLVLALVALLALIGGWGAFRGRATALYAAAWLFAAVLLVAFGVYHLAAQAGPSFLADGRLTARTFSVAELSHVNLVRHGERILGFHPVKLVWSLAFVGLLIVAGAPPAHGWFSRVVTVTPAPVTILVIALRSVAFSMLPRVLLLAVPHGTIWAARTIAVLGLIGVLWSALAAYAARDLGRLAASFSALHAGLVLLALSSLTAIGVQGIAMLAFSHGLVVTLLVVASGVLRDRVGSDSFDALGGLAREVPALSVLVGVGLFGGCAVPGTSGFVATLLVGVGAVPVQRGWVLVAVLALGIVTAAAIRAHARLFSGDVPASLRADPRLEPHGGQFPPLTKRELNALVPLAALVVALGLWPRPLLRLTSNAALDYAAFVNPPGPMEIVRSPHRSREPKHAARVFEQEQLQGLAVEAQHVELAEAGARENHRVVAAE